MAITHITKALDLSRVLRSTKSRSSAKLDLIDRFNQAIVFKYIDLSSDQTV